MYEYRFVRHPVRRDRGTVSDDYQQVVHDRAREGWRLVQVLVEEPATVPSTFVLIFERSV